MYKVVWHGRGIALHGPGNHEEAIAFYDKVIALNQDYAESWCSRIRALVNSDQSSDAVVSHDKAIVLNPHYTPAWTRRGNALNHPGEYSGGIDSSDRAIAMCPDDAGAADVFVVLPKKDQTGMILRLWTSFITWPNPI